MLVKNSDLVARIVQQPKINDQTHAFLFSSPDYSIVHCIVVALIVASLSLPPLFLHLSHRFVTRCPPSFSPVVSLSFPNVHIPACTYIGCK
jgi:hypothetical protein